MSDKPAYMKHMPHFLGPVTPITVDHAEGSWVYGTDGEKWLDFWWASPWPTPATAIPRSSRPRRTRAPR